MPDPGYINYTRSSLAKGMSNEEIILVLRQNGQTDEQIRLIFDAVAGLSTATNVTEATSDADWNTNFNPLKERYAGFWIRLVAAILDSIPFLLLSSIVPLYILSILFFLYGIIMLTLYGATVGKMIVGIKVIKDDGGPLSLSRVLLREIVGKILSSILYIGYIMVAFTRYKQGLHDKIAETYVVYRKN